MARIIFNPSTGNIESANNVTSPLKTLGEKLKLTGGNPLPEDPTKPINPWAPKPIGPVLPNKMMAAKGGLARQPFAPENVERVAQPQIRGEKGLYLSISDPNNPDRSKWLKYKKLVEKANNNFKFIDARKDADLREQAGLNRKAGKNIGRWRAELNIPELDSLATKVKKYVQFMQSDLDAPASKFFNFRTKMDKALGVDGAQTGRILKNIPEYQEIVPVINKLSIAASKARLKNNTIGDVFNMIENRPIPTEYRNISQSPEKFILESAERHVKNGGTQIRFTKKPGDLDVTGKLITDTDAEFIYKGKKYSFNDLSTKGRKLKVFDEIYKMFDLRDELYKKDVIHPKTGKKIKFLELMQEAYNKGAGYSYVKPPYELDHGKSVKKEPFKFIRLIPRRINQAAGIIDEKLFQATQKTLTPAKKKLYSKKNVKLMKENMGYLFNKNIEQLFKDEVKLAKDILVPSKRYPKGRKLRSPIELGNEVIMRLNSGVPVDQISQIISNDFGVPLKAVGNVLGKTLKVLGAASLPLDVIPFAQARNLGIDDWGKTGAKNLAQEYLNLPRTIEDLFHVAGEGTWKDFGSKKEEDRVFDYEPKTFGTKETVKALRNTSNEEIIENIKARWRDIGPGRLGIDSKDLGLEVENQEGIENRIKKALKQKAWADSLPPDHPLVKEEEEVKEEVKETDNVFGTQIPMESITKGFSRDKFLAKGGRVGFADGTPHDDKSDEEILDWIKNQMFEMEQGWNTGKSVPGKILDVARVDNWPYYAARMLRAGMNVAEVSAKLPFVSIDLLQKLATRPAFKLVDAKTPTGEPVNKSVVETGMGEKYMEGFDDSWLTDQPQKKLKGTGLFTEAFKNLMPGAFSEKTGLDSLIEGMEDKMIAQGQSKWPTIAGKNIEMGLDITLPFGYVMAANKYNALKKSLAPYVAGKNPSKVIEEALTERGMSRRDFNKLLVTGGAIGALKYLGLDKLLKGATRNPIPGPIKMIERSSTKMPVWFPKFIDKVNDKMTYHGDGMWSFTGTDDFLPGFHIERIGDDYHISGKNSYEQDFQITYESPKWEGDADGSYYNSGEFIVEDSVPMRTGPDDMDFDGEVVEELHDVLGGTRELEEIGTGKKVDEMTKGEIQVDWAEGRAQSAWDEARDAGEFDVE